MTIKENISLKNKNTFKIGGKARYFLEADTREDLFLGIQKAKDLNLPFFIIGEGSNLLISDDGFKGFCIKYNEDKIIQKDNQLIVSAGVSLTNLVLKTKELEMTGLEWGIGIPGKVGGAIYGNAGAFKSSIGDFIEGVEIFDGKNIKNFKKEECRFDYRDSIFKKKKDLVILSCVLNLQKGEKDIIEKELINNFKQRKNPQGFSIGSIFRNPEHISAGALIEKCGLKGKKIGQAKISEEHANWIINLGDARAKDVESLINLIKKEVKNKFNIELKEEIQRI